MTLTSNGVDHLFLVCCRCTASVKSWNEYVCSRFFPMWQDWVLGLRKAAERDMWIIGEDNQCNIQLIFIVWWRNGFTFICPMTDQKWPSHRLNWIVAHTLLVGPRSHSCLALSISHSVTQSMSIVIIRALSLSYGYFSDYLGTVQNFHRLLYRVFF